MSVTVMDCVVCFFLLTDTTVLLTDLPVVRMLQCVYVATETTRFFSLTPISSKSLSWECRRLKEGFFL